jgi:rhodanese-related sulfurtransferase
MKSTVIASLLVISLLLAGCGGTQAATPSTSAVKPVATTAAPAAATTATTKPPATGAQVSAPAATLPKGVKYITPEELYPQYKVGDETLLWTYQSVDTRETGPFNKGHIRNAVNIPPDTYNTASAKESIITGLKDLPKDNMIVFYDDAEINAIALAGQLAGMGYDNLDIRVLKGGMDAWTAAGYPSRSAEQ